MSPFMKNRKIASISWKIIVQQNLKLLTPKKLASLLFQVSMEMENWHQPLLKNGSHFVENCHTAKFQITDPQKFGSKLFHSLFVSKTVNQYYCL